MELCRAARALREDTHAVVINTFMEDSPATDFQFELWGQIANSYHWFGGQWRCIQKYILTLITGLPQVD